MDPWHRHRENDAQVRHSKHSLIRRAICLVVGQVVDTDPALFIHHDSPVPNHLGKFVERSRFQEIYSRATRDSRFARRGESVNDSGGL